MLWTSVSHSYSYRRMLRRAAILRRLCSGIYHLVVLCMLCSLVHANALQHIFSGNELKQEGVEHIRGAVTEGLHEMHADMRSDGSDRSAAALWEDDVHLDEASAEPFRSTMLHEHESQHGESDAQHGYNRVDTIARSGTSRRMLQARCVSEPTPCEGTLVI